MFTSSSYSQKVITVWKSECTWLISCLNMPLSSSSCWFIPRQKQSANRQRIFCVPDALNFFISPFYYYMYRNLTCIMRNMENTKFLLEVWKIVGEKQYLLPKLREHHTKEQFLSIFYSFAGRRMHYLKCLAGFVFSSTIPPFSPPFAIFLVFPHWHAYRREDIDI